MELDPRTFIITTTFAAFVMTVVFFAQGRSFPKSIGGFKTWGHGLVATTAAAALISGRNYIPDLLSVVFGNALMVIGLWLMLVAASIFLVRPIPWRSPLLCLIVIVIAMGCTTTLADPHQLRTAVGSGVNAWLFGMLLWIMFNSRNSSQFQFGSYFTGCCAFIISLVCLVRLVTVLMGEHDGLLASTLMQRIYLVSFSLGVLLVSIGFSIMGHEKLVENYRGLAIRDELTGLYNRRFFARTAELSITQAARYGRKLSLLLLDVDNFKRINDTYGHAAGDAVLQDIASLMRKNFREADLYARYGGEEFIALINEAEFSDAQKLAERMRQQIEDRRVNFNGHAITYSASFGIAQLCSGESLQQSTARADQALYAAKGEGKNRVRVHCFGTAYPEGV